MNELLSLEKLVEHLKRLPSVGQKSAERMAYALLEFDKETLSSIGETIATIKDKIHPCANCGLYTENELCEYCKDSSRNNDTLIVVSYAKDIQGFSKLEDYKGRFHILGGVLSPSKAKGVETLDLEKLEKRITNDNVKELIIATNPTVEGELTALYLAKKLSHLPLVITRLAYGLPMGGQVDYVDSLTLFKALEGRRELK